MPTAAARLSNATSVELGVAERELRRALTLDPALHEARIRLAHVLSRLGDHRQAVEVVRPALEAPLPPFLGVLRGADPRAQRGTARALRRSGRRLRARRRALPRRAVGRDRPQPRRAGAGAAGRRAEDPRRRRRPVLDRAAGSLARLLESPRSRCRDADQGVAGRSEVILARRRRRGVAQALGRHGRHVAGRLYWSPPSSYIAPVPAAGVRVGVCCGCPWSPCVTSEPLSS